MRRITYSKKILIYLLVLAGCKSQANNDYLQLYQKAMVKYEAKKYYEALKLFKEAIPLMKGKKELISAQFSQAYAFFYEKSYRYSAHCFNEFYKTYPRLEQAEEALYMAGYSYYLDMSDIRLDQEKAQKAYQLFSTYREKYPEGKYKAEVDKYANEAYYGHLAYKAYKNARLYIKLGDYQAAVVSLNNFQQDYPGDVHQEKAAYLKLKSQFKFAMEGPLDQRLSRLRMFVSYYYEFIDEYVTSPYRAEIEGLYKSTVQEINQILINP